MRKAPTRFDVAQRAGVSEAVVSYVMNDGPRPVSAHAKARVLEAIEHLGYRPNQVARALRANRSRSIGLLVPDALNPFFGELTQHIERECRERGYMLFIGTTSNDAERERHYLGAFAERQVDGMIVISSASDWEHSGQASIPLILVDRSPARAADAVAKSDHALGAEAAVRHLLEVHERRRVLLLAGPEGLDSTRARLEGALRVIAAFPGVTSEVVHSAFAFDDGHAVTRQTLVACRDVDALFAFSDVQAIGAIRACEDAGIRVPHDVSVAAFDGTELARYTRPRITSVVQDVAAIASAAMDRLTGLIAGETVDSDAGPHAAAHAPHLRMHESCGCADSELR